MNQPGASARSSLAALARRVMVDHGLEPDFPPAAVAEVAAIRSAPTEPGVRDQRALLWCSIDNDDSRDLDQLSVGESLGGGATRIRVAVADVDATVHAGSAVDAHAQKNTTSVYTSAGVFPMLPEKLSTDLTSLNAGVVRLAIIIDMEIGADGTVGKSDVYRAVVQNKAKLAYNSVAAWLDGAGPIPPAVAAVAGMDAQLRMQDRAAQAMKCHRHRNGALTLETIEAHAVFDGDALSDVRCDRKNRAKDLIEDFMVAANGVTAAFLKDHGYPSIRRVLRSPERWERIVTLAAEYHERLPEAPDGAALEAFLTKRRDADPDHFPDLALSVVKLLGRGEYALETVGATSPGHFGLAVRSYTHSTAPNRRYPDVITQRLLKAALAGKPTPYPESQLDALARHCTEQEDQATKVERQMLKSAAALLLHDRVGAMFDAIVTGASEKGTWVRIAHPTVEGKVVRGGEKLDVGDRVKVELLHTDVEKGFIDFAAAGRR